jgi:LacI family transcriptional regulator
MGLQIGKDISLFGFDNQNISQSYIPALSTVEPPLNEIGRHCAEIILNRIKRQTTGKKRIFLPCNILERNSIAEKKCF